MAYYANIIIDISTGKLDRTFQYRIPEELFAQIYPGVQVNIPFGKNNRMVSGFVIEVTDQAEYDEKKLKEIDSVASDLVIVETQLIALAVWMREKLWRNDESGIKDCTSDQNERSRIKKRRRSYLLRIENRLKKN